MPRRQTPSPRAREDHAIGLSLVGHSLRVVAVPRAQGTCVAQPPSAVRRSRRTGARDAIWNLSKDGFKLPVGEAPANAASPLFHSPMLVLVDRNGLVKTSPGWHGSPTFRLPIKPVLRTDRTA